MLNISLNNAVFVETSPHINAVFVETSPHNNAELVRFLVEHRKNRIIADNNIP